MPKETTPTPPQSKFKNKKVFFYLLGFMLLFAMAWAAITHFLPRQPQDFVFPPFRIQASQWADSLVATLTLEEKAGQLIFYDAQNASHTAVIEAIKANQAGGLIIRADSLQQHVALTNEYQASASVPLFWALKTTNAWPNYMNDIQQFPPGVHLAALRNDSLLADYNMAVAKMCKTLNFSWIFAPSLSSLTQNQPYDSLYETYRLQQAADMIEVLQNEKIIACSQQFSNYSFFENDSLNFLATKDVFNYLINKEISALFLEEDSFDNPQLCTEYINKAIVNQGFKGLLLFSPNAIEKELVLQHLSAGVDMFLVDNEPARLFEIIRTAVAEGDYKEKDLDAKVKKILQAKYWAFNYKQSLLNENTVREDINTVENTQLSRRLYEASLTLLTDTAGILPVSNLQNKRFLFATFAADSLTCFFDFLHFYTPLRTAHFSDSELKTLKNTASNYNFSVIAIQNLPNDSVFHQFVDVLKAIKKKNTPIVVNFGSLHRLDSLSRYATVIQAYSATPAEQRLASQLVFGGSSATGRLPWRAGDSLTYNSGTNTVQTRLKYGIPENVNVDSKILQRIDSIALVAIRGGATPGCQVFAARKGQVIVNNAYGFTAWGSGLGVKWNTLYDVASVTKIAATTIATMKMMAEGRLSLSTKLEECFENTEIEYTKIKPDTIINIDTLLVSKVRNMKKLLEVQDTIHLNDSVIVAFDTLLVRATPMYNIFQVEIEHLLRHQSGILPSLPVLPLYLYRMNYDKNNFKITAARLEQVMDSLKNSPYQIDYQDSLQLVADTLHQGFYKYYLNQCIDSACGMEIARNFYLRKSYWDTLWIDVKQMSVYSRAIPQYTDVNMLLLQQAIDSLNDYTIEEYLQEKIYAPLGLQMACFQPLNRGIALRRIAPTEHDKIWRMQLLHGHVHDPTAAFFGGMAGNAGLFSNAHDLGILAQMLLNKGKYGGMQILPESIVELFSRRQDDSNRGLGFDMRFEQSIIADSASDATFGHTGFTGCCVWIDPEYELVYVFLSNRVHPNASNWLLNAYDVRERIHQTLYDAMTD